MIPSEDDSKSFVTHGKDVKCRINRLLKQSDPSRVAAAGSKTDSPGGGGPRGPRAPRVINLKLLV